LPRFHHADMAGRQRPFSERRLAMSATPDWRLYQLYMEFGEAQDRRSRQGEAADAYALALYFARRLNDPARIHECRQLVLSRNPNHVAAQAVSAPLFFAQLLMRYPADEVEMMLTAGKQEYSSPTVAVAEEEPIVQTQNTGRTFRQAQAAKPSFDGFARTAHHHSEPTYEGMSRTSVRPIIAEDVLLADAGLLDDPETDDRRGRSSISDLSTAAKALAAGTIASGLLLVAYLGYTLYPVFHQMKSGRGSDGSADSIIFAEDDSPKVVDPPSQTTPAPKPIFAQPIVKEAAKSGANTPVSLADEPPTKLTARPTMNNDASSQK
jgi:hypothetical protein